MLCACTNAPLGPVDAGSDLSRCTMLAGAVADWIAAHRSCVTDADCVTVRTACGLPSVCGAFVSKSAPGAELTQLVDTYRQTCAAQAMCACDLTEPLPGCNAGVCGYLMASRAVGEPCASGADCKTAECVTAQEVPGFTGGYCTIRDCAIKNVVCPAGSSCKTVGTRSYCLKDCKTAANPSECRTDYGCCSGAGPVGENGWCAPTTSALCMAD